MFKRLRERIAEEATKFPVGQLNNNSGKQLSDSESKTAVENSTEDLITLSDSSAVVVPHTSPRQFSIGDEDGSISEQNTPQKKQNDTSSTSTSELPSQNTGQRNHGTGSDFGYAQEYRPSRSSYVPQSDIESEREDPPTLNLESISKDQLLTIIDVLKARSHKYKNKYSEVVKNYKELRDEKLKIENTLIENQDKGLRRMAELREQCQLEQKAKAHLEANLRLLMEEKDSRISVLETQINLLKGDKTDTAKSFQEGDSLNSDASSGDLPSDSCTFIQDASTLKEKIERLEHQSSQAKKTITSQTEQISVLKKQNETVYQQLEEKMKTINEMEEDHTKLQLDHENILKNMKIRLEELEKKEEESVMSMAETKRNMHVELEFKEKQLKKAEEEAKEFQNHYESEKLKVIELQKKHEEKIHELQRQLDSTEKMLEEEKHNLMQEFARGKTAAITLMQQECDKKLLRIEEEWKTKLQEVQVEQEKNKQSQNEDDEKKVSALEEKLKLSERHAIELQTLKLQFEKENRILKSSLEKLESDFAFTSAKLEKLQVEYMDLKEFNEKESLRYEEKLKQELNDRLQIYEQTEADHHHLREFLKEQLNEKQNVIDDMVHNKNALYIQIDELEKRETDLKSKTEVLENEVKELNCKLNDLKVRFKTVSEGDQSKSQELCKLQKHLEQIQLNENRLIKELDENKIINEGLKLENNKMELCINLLKEDTEKMKEELFTKKEEVDVLNNALHDAKCEFSVLNETLGQKLESYSKLLAQFSAMECSLTSLENGDKHVKSTIAKQNHLYSEMSERIEILCEGIKSIKKSECNSNKFISKPESVLEKSSASNQKATSLCDMLEHTENKVSKSCADSNQKENVNVECADVKELQNTINGLVKENQTLRVELSELKEASEIQNIEFAKNITQLHESLNELQDERNNLSLVLQSIETQGQEKSSESVKNVESSLSKRGASGFEFGGRKENEIHIVELNNKVKSEIAALAAQTDLITQELNKLREQFNFSQLTYSEKIAQLNSKLLVRTEQIISVKNDLDMSLENGRELQCLLDSMKEQLDEKDELIKVSEKHKQDLENKCKALNEKFIKQEMSLKQTHNSQLSALKDQTKATIDKLNEEIQKANATLKENEIEFHRRISNAKDQCDQEVLKLAGNHEECRDIITKISDTSIVFEKEFFNSLKVLDLYNSKISNLNSKLNNFVRKLQEKDNFIDKQQTQISDLENQLKIAIEGNKELQNVKSKLNEISDLLEKSKSELEIEKYQKKLCEDNLLGLKETHIAEMKRVENINSLAKVEIENLKSMLNKIASEHEATKLVYATACSDLDNAKFELKDLKSQNVNLENLQLNYNSLVRELECVKESLKIERASNAKATMEWKSLYNMCMHNLDKFKSKSYESMDLINLSIANKEAKLKSFESHFCNLSSKIKKQIIEGCEVGNEIEKVSSYLVEEIESQNITEMQIKCTDLEQKIKEITETENMYREEIQKKLEDALSKLTASETKNELQSIEIANLQCKIKDSLAQLEDTERNLADEKTKLAVLENCVKDRESKYNLAVVAAKEASDVAKIAEDKLQNILREVDEKNSLLDSMAPKIETLQKLNDDNSKSMNAKIDNLHKLVDTLTAEVTVKETEVKKIRNEQANLETRNDESLKCMKEKLENAEKNYITQMDEMKSRLSLLEKEKLALKTEKAELLKGQEKLTDLKNIESSIKAELKLKEDELRKLQQKYETTNKDQVAKIHSFQETMKDKENMILKLKANVEALNKDNFEKQEELRKKIKALEVEREQLMMQAQERVSITEAKFREDIKALQEKNNKLIQDNNEIEKLKTKFNQLVKEDRESLSLLEAAKEEILHLKDKLSKTEEKLSEAQNLKQSSEAELLGKLQMLQDENSSLLGKTNHVESLKAEKEELNKKLKEAEHQVTSIKALETERDSLVNENKSLLKELELLKSNQVEDSSLQQKCEFLKESENSLRIELDDLKSSKEDLETKFSETKTLFEKEIQLLKLENEKLSKQVGMLEKFHSSDPESTSVKDYIAVVRGECETAIKAKEEEMETKLKHLVRDFCIQMDVKDKDCDKMIAEMIEKSQDVEDRLLREHRKEASELRQSLFEKECALDEMRDHYEETLQKKEKKLKELQLSLKKVAESVQNDPACSDVLPISEEGSDWDDTWAVPDESVENASPVHGMEPCTEHLQQIESLQEEVTKCNSEIKELKILLRLSPPESMVNNNNRRDSLQSIPEPTEFEYLKNIIYEYMMGKEPITLAKVIAAVLRFSDSQTQQVIRREEARHPTR